MQTAELSRLAFDLPKGYIAVPISGEHAAAAIRLNVVCRKEGEPVGGPLVVLREMIDARVYLGCLTDAAGRVQRWLELWIQDTDRIEAAPPAYRAALNHAVLDKRWSDWISGYESLDPRTIVRTGFENKHPAPVFIEAAAWAPWHPIHDESNSPWALCTDESLLEKAGLPSYRASLHRYLFVPALGTDGPFAALSRESPPGNVPFDEVTQGRVDLIPFNAGAGLMLARTFDPLALEGFSDVVAGKRWDGVPHGRNLLTLLKPSDDDLDLGVSTEAEGLFLGRHGRWGRMVESLHLKLKLLADATLAVRAIVSKTALPMLNVSADSFRVRLSDSAAGVPTYWTSRVDMVNPGSACELPLPRADARYFIAPDWGRGSIYRPKIESTAATGQGLIRIRKVMAHDGDDVVVEATFNTEERFVPAASDLVWLRVSVGPGRADLYGHVDTKQALAGGEWRFRSVPQQFEPEILEAMKAAEGVPLPNSPYEVIPLLSSPIDLYSLAVLGTRLLLVNGQTTLAVAIDELLSLARQIAQDVQGGKAQVGDPLPERIGALFSADPRWMLSLGPQRLIEEDMDPGEALDLIPPALWFEVLAALVRALPGVGADSSCRDYGDAPSEAPQRVFHRLASDLAHLLVRTRSLIVIDWRYNREVHAVLRRYLTGVRRQN